MSMGGNKIKPTDLFESLKVIQSSQIENKSVSEKFFEKFKHKFTEGNPFSD